MSAPPIRAAVIPDEGDFAWWLRHAAARGFTHVEIEGREDRPAEHPEALAETGLFVACVRLGRGLGAEGAAARRAILERQKRMVADAARLGATAALLAVPEDTSDEARAYFAEGRDLLSAFAGARGVRLVVLGEEAALQYERVPLSSEGPA